MFNMTNSLLVYLQEQIVLQKIFKLLFQDSYLASESLIACYFKTSLRHAGKNTRHEMFNTGMDITRSLYGAQWKKHNF